MTKKEIAIHDELFYNWNVSTTTLLVSDNGISVFEFCVNKIFKHVPKNAKHNRRWFITIVNEL